MSIAKVVAALNGRGKSIKGSRVLVLGIAYKKNVDDMRESPSVDADGEAAGPRARGRLQRSARAGVPDACATTTSI